MASLFGDTPAFLGRRWARERGLNPEALHPRGALLAYGGLVGGSLS